MATRNWKKESIKVVHGQSVTAPHTKNSEVLENALTKAKAFFGFSIAVKLNIIKNISAICKEFKIKKEKIPSYAVGFFKGNKIFVFDKKLFPKRGHSKDEFEKVVMHELCHIFIRKVVKRKIPVWIEEGLCQYLAFPQIKSEKTVELKKLNSYNDWYKLGSPYSYCSAFFAFLIKKYGKKHVLTFLHLLNKKRPEKAFFETFNVSLSKCEANFKKEIANEKTV